MSSDHESEAESASPRPSSTPRTLLAALAGALLAVIMVPGVVITYVNLTGGLPDGPTSAWLIPLVCYLSTGLAAFVLGRRGIWPNVMSTYAMSTVAIAAVLIGLVTLTH